MKKRNWATAADRNPLGKLADRLTIGPPTITSLLSFLDSGEYLLVFAGLIDEYLPGKRREIMTGTEEERVRKFGELFGKAYFPLSDSDIYDGEIERIVQGVPIDLYGITGTNYEELDDWSEGELMMMALCHTPYGEWTGHPGDGGKFHPNTSLKIALFDELKPVIGVELLSQIPGDGWDAKVLHRLTDGTKFEGIGAFADWIGQDTGYIWTDGNWDEYGPSEWDPELVARLKQQYKPAMKLLDDKNRLARWLEGKKPEHFAQLLGYLRLSLVPKEQLPLPLNIEGDITKNGKTLVEIFDEEAKHRGKEKGPRVRIRVATVEDFVAGTAF